ncbi:hypothetical protein HOLleu_02474 [Holothuria leucospilota]|uniref:Immunoglobulin domain-containing protein n=1 Tax=Holothuria leucospilota TaxID=206669 RepID=A0A9Q1CSG1_HOLLE|nr:hypothetical protein HOLleu_02474 [Holothuria leucospilota]
MVDIAHSYQFLESPLNTTAIEGGVAIFPCRVGSTDTSQGPQYSYWTRLKDSHLISENNDVEKYAELHRSFAERISVISEAPYEFRLQISDLELEDAGYYVCWHLDENNYNHYSEQAYLNILPRTTETWFPSCSVTKVSGSDNDGVTVGSVVRFTCQAPNGLQLPRDIALYVKNGHESGINVPIATCDHVPCSFEYTLSLVDINSRFICGTQINNEVYEEECTITPLRQRQEINLESVPKILEVNSNGKLLCWTADYGTNYEYQWFLNDTAVSRLQNENHYSITNIYESMNNSVVTCVVSDAQGYVGSESIHLLVATATDNSHDDQMVSAEGIISYSLKPTRAVVDLTEAEKDLPSSKFPGLARPSEAPIMDQSFAKTKLFGIPIEFLFFMLGMILILLLLLIIVVLLVQRQKRQQSDLTMEREKNVGDIEKGVPSLKLNSKGDVIILKSPTPQCSCPPSSNEPSFYDNVPSKDENQLSCQQVQLFNEDISFGMAGLTGLQISDDNKHWSVQDTDYTILDPDVVSEDSLDFCALKDVHQHPSSPRDTPQAFAPNQSGRTFSVKNQPSNLTKHSHASRQTSLPVPLNSPSSLYAVTSLITPEEERRFENMENLGESSGPSNGTGSSRPGSQSDYATPNNRPKSKNFTLAECAGEDSSPNIDGKSNVTSDFTKEHVEKTSHNDDDDQCCRPISELSARSAEYAEISDSHDSSKSASANSLNSNCHSMISAEVTINSPAAIVKLESPTDGTEKIVILDDSKYIRNCRKAVTPVENANLDGTENMLEAVL